MKEIDPKICFHCGATKFKPFHDLNLDERMIAEKRMGTEPKEVRPDKLVCARCFIPIGGEHEQAELS